MTVMHRWFKVGDTNMTYCGKRLETVKLYTSSDKLTTCRHCLRAMAQYTMNRVTVSNDREHDENHGAIMTTPDTAAVPPERCPICGETEHQVFSDHKGPWGRRFACGADWLETGKWYAPCKYAMDAALRCGATLEPTPREVARDELVAACLVELAAEEEVDRARTGSEKSWIAAKYKRDGASNARIVASFTYRATEPQ